MRNVINIKDIESQRLLYPEPPEVTNTRELICEYFSDLVFLEGPHQYFVGNIEYPSVSSVCHQFEPPVDWDKIADRKAKKLGVHPEELKEDWHLTNITSTACGSKTHFFGENLMNLLIGREEEVKKNMGYQFVDGYLIPYCPKEWAIMKYYQDILSNPKVFPVIPESKIYTRSDLGLKTRYAGTFDILMAYEYRGEIVYSIHDFKGLPLDTPILTTNGWKTMGELQLGDYVYDKNGEPTKITGVSEVHSNPCMKITFDDGFSVVADHEHRWEISFRDRWSSGKVVIKNKIMTTSELYEYNEDLRKKDKQTDAKYIPKIFIGKPLSNKNLSKLPIDPYVLGIWLGDGSAASGHITCMYDEIFEEIEKRGYSLGKDVSGGGSGLAKTRCVFGLHTKLRELNLVKNKHVPQVYIVSSTYQERLDLLRGLMDSDGTYNKKRNRFYMNTTRKCQADYYVEVLVSLGIKPTLMKTYTYYREDKIDVWSVAFSTPINPFLRRNQDIKCTPGNQRYTFRNIVKIEKVPTVLTRCIEVESDTHTYLATKMLLVTHNTNKDLKNDYNREKGNRLLEPFDDLINEPLSIYYIQLSLYQIGLQQLGLPVIDRNIIWLQESGEYTKIQTPDLTERLLKIL